MKWQALILLCAFVFTARATYDAELEELTKAEDSIDSILKSLDELSGIEDEELEDGSNEETIYEKIEHLNEGSDVVAEEELEEMDIKTENDNGNGKRNALRDTRKLWYHRDIAYVLDSTLTASKKTIITNAINDMASQTCIKFHVRRANDTGTYLNIKSAGGCWSYVGKTSRTQQDLSIGDGCQYKGIIQHELLHALGFYHEQSRYDRDTYVEIKWENIQSGREGNFRIQSKLSTRNTGTGYDFDSVMHYGKTAFSKNGKATIEVIGNSQQYLGQRSKMSQTDLDSLNRLYHCDTNKQVLAADQWTGWSDYGGCHIFRAGETCRKKRYRFCSTFDQCACDTTTNVTLCNEQVEDCQPSSCYADGNWGVWSSWSACSATTNCAKGVKTRTRQCNNPPPTAGGKACNGTGTGSSVCEALCPRECTFDDGNNCGYTTSGRFYRKKGTTPSSGTGPSSDFSGTGEYMFTEASTPGYPYKKSTLLSPVFQATGSPQCFSMRYHMYGSDIGSLTVIVIDGTAAPRQVWQMQGNQGNQWFKAQFNIISAAPFRISLNATSGKSYRGDLAVDNLFLNRTLCDTVTSTIAPPVTTTPSPDGNWGAWSKWSACSATADCAKGVKTRTRQCNNPPPTAAGKSCVGTGTNSLICQTSCPRHCTFDDGNNCGYTTSGRFLRRKGSTPSSLTGPTSDYSGTGEYMFTETSSPGYPNKVSTLKSPVFQPTGSPQCFSMRYHMYGANIGILTVIVLSNGTAAPRQVWQRQGQQGNQWFKAQFNIISATPFRILINGTSGNGYRGDIAVDNLFLNRTSCAGTVFTSTSAPVTSTIGPGSSTSSPWSSTSNPGSSTSSPWSSTYRPPRSTSGPWSSTYRPPYSTSGPWSSTSGPSTTVQPIPPNSILAFNVSFDGSMGGMVNQAPFPGAAIGKTHWKLRSSVNTWIGSAPITDRVFEGGSFLAVTGEDDSDVGRIVAVSSQSMNGTGSTSLIEFYYNMWTGSLKSGSFAKMGVLSVDVIVGGGLPQTIFRTFDGHNGAWQYARAKVDVPAGSKFHLVFKATLGSAPMMIAIDDIKGLPHTTSTFLFQKVFSPSALACSFSNQANSSCYWRLGGDFKWKPQHGETPSQDTGPDSPGSVTGSKQHRYLYAEATGRNPGDSATMYSGFIYSKRPMCMYLYSNTHGDGRLTGGIRTSKRSQVVHDLTKNTWSGKWQFNFVPLPVNKFFMVVINATVGTSYKSDVALDNIFVAPGRCVNHSSAYKLICDFDATTKCLGVNSKGFKIASDNSGSNKYFKAKHDSGNATILIGLTVDQAGACLTYQYRITPRDPSSQALVRYRMMAHGRTLMEEKLKPEAEGGKDWKYFMKTIPPRSKKEKVMVQFAASFNGLHSVAEIDIDDIHVQQRMCPDYGQASAPATVAKGVPMAY